MHEMKLSTECVSVSASGDLRIVDSPSNSASNYRTRPLGLQSGVEPSVLPRRIGCNTKGPGEIASHTLRREEAKGVAAKTVRRVCRTAQNHA